MGRFSVMIRAQRGSAAHALCLLQPEPRRPERGRLRRAGPVKSKALGQTWEETYAGLVLEGFLRGDLPNADSVWGPYLRKHGFTRHLLPDACPDCYTVADFAADYPQGTYILSMPGRHVLCVQDGQWHDSWDSGMEVP